VEVECFKLFNRFVDYKKLVLTEAAWAMVEEILILLNFMAKNCLLANVDVTVKGPLITLTILRNSKPTPMES
jgi:hypothetical protein